MSGPNEIEPVAEVDRKCTGLIKWTALGMLASSTMVDGTKLYSEHDVVRLQAENALLRHESASFLETMAKTCELLNIDLDDACHADGNPSDVLFSHAQSLQSDVETMRRKNNELNDTVATLQSELTPVYDQATVEALLTELDAMTELLRSIANPHSVGEAFANAVKVRKAMGIAATHSADEGEI